MKITLRSSAEFLRLNHYFSEYSHQYNIFLDRCNYACKNCPTAMAAHTEKNPVIMKKIKTSTEKTAEGISARIKNGYHLVIQGGEPFLQGAALIDMVQKIKKERQIGAHVLTNGSVIPHIDLSAIDTIVIDPYFLDPEHTKYCGQPLAPVVKNVKWLLNSYNGDIRFSIPIFPYFQNIENTTKWCEFWKKIDETGKITIDLKRVHLRSGGMKTETIFPDKFDEVISVFSEFFKLRITEKTTYDGYINIKEVVNEP